MLDSMLRTVPRRLRCQLLADDYWYDRWVFYFRFVAESRPDLLELLAFCDRCRLVIKKRFPRSCRSSALADFQRAYDFVFLVPDAFEHLKSSDN